MLSRPQIEKYLSDGVLQFEPEIDKDAIAQVSVDLRLGRKFSRFKKIPDYINSVNVSYMRFLKFAKFFEAFNR